MTDAQERPLTGAVFTLREAADVCAVSLSTIRRRHSEKAFPNAYQDGSGTWRIPVADLLAAGLRVNAPEPAQAERVTDAHDRPVTDAAIEALKQEVAALEDRLRGESHRRELAELRAQFAERSADDLRMAMRMLDAARPPVPAESAEDPEPERRGFLHRVFQRSELD